MRSAPCLALAALTILLAGCGGADAPAGPPRNLLFLSLDTLRPDRLGCYGHDLDTSPTIDALAARGVRFADASSAAPWTLPSHTTMFTGLYPSHHGVKDYSHQLGQEAVTLAEVLRERGFQTWAVINTWNIADPRFEIFQGFDRADVHYVRETEGDVIVNSGRSVAAKTRELLAGRDRSRPFFMFAHFYDTHSDFAPAPEYRERFVKPYAGRVTGQTGLLFALRANGIQLAPADVEHLFQLYDAEIAELDDVLADLMAWLREEGLEDDTLIVLTSDHGEEFQEHGGLLHGRTQYQELLSVPLILAGPGVPAGRVVDQPVSLVDLLPTILGLFGLPVPGPVDGVDLAPTWRGERLPERMLFGEADHNNVVDGENVIDIKRMARLGDRKLHLDRHDGSVRLYDLGSDPGETRDRSGQDPDGVRLLREALSRFLDGAVAGQESGEELSPEDLELLRKLGYAGDE